MYATPTHLKCRVFQIKQNVNLIWSQIDSWISSNILLPFESFVRLVTVQSNHIWSNMNFAMFFKISLFFVSLAALFALEWSLPCVFLHVALQMTRRSASIVALVTFERLFSCVLSHRVKFQPCSCNAWILAACASVRLFSRVRPLVPLQAACLCCFIFTLIALV